MWSSLKPVAAGACASVLATGLLAGPATAAPSVPTLVLSIRDQHTPVVSGSRTLGCDNHPGESSGSHPRRDRACDALAAAEGKFENLKTTGMSCPMIYDPVTATAKGRYKGVRINFEADYPNACVAAAMSDNVFSW